MGKITDFFGDCVIKNDCHFDHAIKLSEVEINTLLNNMHAIWKILIGKYSKRKIVTVNDLVPAYEPSSPLLILIFYANVPIGRNTDSELVFLLFFFQHCWGRKLYVNMASSNSETYAALFLFTVNSVWRKNKISLQPKQKQNE